MTRADNRGPLEATIEDIRSIADEFARVSTPVVEAALRRRLEALFDARRSWYEDLRTEVVDALRAAADRAITQAAADVGRRLRESDLWFEPRTAPGVVPRPEAGWEGMLPEWISGLLRRFSSGTAAPSLGELDDPGHRVWVTLLSAAKSLDPVLEEFGLTPSTIPDLGGGHYGLRPKTAAQLDPSGSLLRLWKRYRLAFDRYSALTRD